VQGKGSDKVGYYKEIIGKKRREQPFCVLIETNSLYRFLVGVSRCWAIVLEDLAYGMMGRGDGGGVSE